MAELDGPEGSIAKVTQALVKAQAQFKPCPKAGFNPHFKSHFATLEDIMESIREPLTSNGLAITHEIKVQSTADTVEWVMVTRLLHESGQFLETTLPVKIGNAQQVGSELSYMKRYGLSALVAVVSDEDDDGEAAVSSPPPRRTGRPERTNLADYSEPGPAQESLPTGPVPRSPKRRASAPSSSGGGDTRTISQAQSKMAWAKFHQRLETFGTFEKPAVDAFMHEAVDELGMRKGRQTGGSMTDIPMAEFDEFLTIIDAYEPPGTG